MTDNVESFAARIRIGDTEVRYAYEFDCVRCHYHIYSAVHYGHRRLCLTCQFVLQAELDDRLRDNFFGQDPDP
jgi:hypothetical protein